MSRPVKYAVRFLCLVAVLGIIAVALSNGPLVSTPYVSALSPLVVQPAYAAKCPNQICQRSPRGGYICVTNHRTSCSPNHQLLTCTTSNC